MIEFLYYNNWKIEKHYHEYGGLEYYCVWVDDKCKKFDYLDDAYEFIDLIEFIDELKNKLWIY